MNGEQEKKIAKDAVNLKKVETRSQKVNLSEKELELMRKFEQESNPKIQLTNDEVTIINILEKKKLFLERIVIKLNQTRAALGMTLFRKNDILTVLDSLTKKGYVTTRTAPNGQDVYYLTEQGLDFLGIM
ncbi:MAG: hypothetical protein ACTSYS_09650 [Promethearchaeota archaeon]